MLDISNFLDKFLKLEKDNKTKIAFILDSIKESTNLIIQKENLEIKGDNIRINCSPIIRNEIFMRKDAIENSLKSKKIFLKLI